MPGPLPYFRPGESAFPALNADVLNAMVAGIRGRRGKERTTVSDVVRKSTIECMVLNNTSADYDIHSIMSINSSASAGLTLVSDQDKIDFQRRPLFTVNVPVADTDYPFILLEPLKANGGLARAAIGGQAVCTVNISDTAHEYANPIPGDHTRMASDETGQVRIIHKPAGTGDKVCSVFWQSSGEGGGDGNDNVADHVHVVGYGGSGGITCRRVSLSDPAAWPPEESDPVVEYVDVWESENRIPRIIDSPGTATHIIPLYKDRDGNYYIQFWKTDTFDDLELPVGFTITEDPETCIITATPVLETYRLSRGRLTK